MGLSGAAAVKQHYSVAQMADRMLDIYAEAAAGVGVLQAEYPRITRAL